MAKYRINGIALLTEFFLMALALSIVLGAIAYEGKQQLVAWVIGFPTIGFLVLLIIAELAPSLLKFTRAFGVSEDDAPEQANSSQMESGTWRRVGIVYGWLVGYFISIFFLGFYIATPIFLISFLNIESKLKLSRTIGVMLVALIPFFIIFRIILDIPLWPGILPKLVPGIIGGGSIPPLT
ncbi:MAG: hypothetical protein FI734_03260 [SAR202 cluster bacterium]|nr:hypothetical protein [SAR202 cluster bacterium]|tara:strand:+ start:1764 stop:2306 length:543 start_codon:yes stop_codon:yes gene_type:complete